MGKGASGQRPIGAFVCAAEALSAMGAGAAVSRGDSESRLQPVSAKLAQATARSADLHLKLSGWEFTKVSCTIASLAIWYASTAAKWHCLRGRLGERFGNTSVPPERRRRNPT